MSGILRKRRRLKFWVGLMPNDLLSSTAFSEIGQEHVAIVMEGPLTFAPVRAFRHAVFGQVCGRVASLGNGLPDRNHILAWSVPNLPILRLLFCLANGKEYSIALTSPGTDR